MQGQISGNQRLSSAIKSHLLLFLLQNSLSKKGTGWGISHPDWVSRKGFKPELGLKLMSLKMVSEGQWGVDPCLGERGAGGRRWGGRVVWQLQWITLLVLCCPAQQPAGTFSHFLWGDLTRSWCKEGRLPARSWRSHSADAGRRPSPEGRWPLDAGSCVTVPCLTVLHLSCSTWLTSLLPAPRLRCLAMLMDCSHISLSLKIFTTVLSPWKYAPGNLCGNQGCFSYQDSSTSLLSLIILPAAIHHGGCCVHGG